MSVMRPRRGRRNERGDRREEERQRDNTTRQAERKQLNHSSSFVTPHFPSAGMAADIRRAVKLPDVARKRRSKA
jgi:hypothetical protein